MATNGAPRSTSAGGSKSRLSQLRAHYRAATSAFLVRDYGQTAISLEEARLLLPQGGKEDAWLSALVEGREEPELDMERKLAIFRITFLATVASSSPSPSSLELYPAAISKLLSLPPAALIPTLWHSLLPSTETSSPADLGTGLDVFPTPSAAFLHPSLIVALSLGALKIEQPAQARAVLEAWFGSVGESVERVAWEESGVADWAGEFSLSGGGEGMSSSGILSGPPPAGTKPEPRKALLASWIKAMDLLVLHVMPRLGEWEAAGDFVRLQGVENGGWVPDLRVEAALAQLTQLQQQEALAHASRLQRQRQQKEQQAQADSAAKSRSSRRDAKGKGRAPSSPPLPQDRTKGANNSSSGGSSSSSAGKPSPPASPSKATSSSRPAAAEEAPSTGFASLRTSLSSYLIRSSPSHDTLTPNGSTFAPPSSALSRLPLVRTLLQSIENDPLRLLSFICAFLALLGWVRRRRRSGKKGLGVGEGLARVGEGVSWGVGRVVEVVRMGTKVTQL
ncbi:hypothetical protein BCR35DRAFT_302945 [Leucosporidium creatinivorum]|uniref:Uncharacterized protein n=1 Tax=Leucosporidium creatinivorum TaxID=106004 RepID=A0A1Y2FMR1_9BASI|nr:hypothetical protein BCR35DRAFT_302945 [Leucosporidium creatinivorum]